MNSFMGSTFKILLSVEFIIGNVGNGFIALVNCMDSVKKRKISPVDEILTALAISRIGLFFSVVIIKLAFMAYPEKLMTKSMLRMINVIWIVTNHFSIWLAACLNVFYFLKVAYFTNSIFLYLKWRVKKVVSMTLLMSLFVLFLNIIVISIPAYSCIDGSKINISSSSGLRNSTWSFKLFLFTNSMFALIPYTLSLTTCLLLILSLCKHLKKMKQNAKGFRDANIVAHIKAMQMGMSLVLLYTVFLLVLTIQISHIEFLDDDMIVSLDYSMGAAFSASHSIVLILGNSKLRQTSLSVLWWLRNSCKCAALKFLKHF
ncbi:PREDICTED: taste receptor type 2 member 140-like [Chinchilla lanigera]|uniref:taste receptor type 2 member 140-like n=1 Tax=Chinchilla lanigera TaxID=34839 RepID=UPI00038EACA4|nr:PREDICTED: taste receptor type 2 member 140-like [Chinchilla lanigera]